MDAPSPTLIDDICSDDPARVSAALQAAAPHGETLAPELLARLQAAAVIPAEGLAKNDHSSPMFLCYLAAAWKLTEAHPLLVTLLRLPGDHCSTLLGDFITEGAQQVLADTWPGNLDAIEALVLDPRAYAYARGAGIAAVAQLTARGRLPREDALAFFTRVAATPLDPDNEDDVQIGNELIDTFLNLSAWELRGTVSQLFERNLVDPGYAGDQDAVLAELEPGVIFDPTTHRFSPPITDAWTEVSSWPFFDPLFPDDRQRWTAPLPDPDRQSPPSAPAYSWEPRQPVIAPPKVGRNDPCPCGSGKKYKKCCGG